MTNQKATHDFELQSNYCMQNKIIPDKKPTQRIILQKLFAWHKKAIKSFSSRKLETQTAFKYFLRGANAQKRCLLCSKINSQVRWHSARGMNKLWLINAIHWEQ